MTAPEQLALATQDPARCRFCGRSWPGLLGRDRKGDFLDLATAIALPLEERAAAFRCWAGTCREGRGNGT